MRNIKFSELSSLEYNEVYSFVKNCVEESFNTCPDEWKDSYKDMTLSDYRDSLITDVWSDEGDNLGEGFSVIAFNVLNDDEDALAEMFEQVRDEIWNEYMATLEGIFSEYDYKRELEVCYDRHSNRILIYEYVAHTKDEEGGDFIADFDLAEFETEFEKKFGYVPEVMKDYNEI